MAERGEVFCPRRLSTMARDACIRCQAEDRCGVGCGEGRRAILERIEWDKAEDRSDVAEVERRRFSQQHYERYVRPRYLRQRAARKEERHARG